MVIGISGKKQSGKDTVAKIIQGFDIWKNDCLIEKVKEILKHEKII